MRTIFPILLCLFFCSCPCWDDDTDKNSLGIINCLEDGREMFFSVSGYNGRQYDVQLGRWVQIRQGGELVFTWTVEEDLWKAAFTEHGWKTLHVHAFRDEAHFREWQVSNDDGCALKTYVFSFEDIDRLGLDRFEKGSRDVWIYYPYDGIYPFNDRPDELKIPSGPDHFGNK